MLKDQVKPPQQTSAVLVPLPLFKQLGQLIQELPYRQVDGVLQQMTACQSVSVAVNQPENEDG